MRSLAVCSLHDACHASGLTAERLMTFVDECGVDVDRTGEGEVSETTLEDSGDGLRYRVADGSRIQRDLPELWDFYTGAWVDIAEVLTGDRLCHQESARGAISVNRIGGDDGRYEKHLDDSTYTGVLYLNSLPLDAGGHLLLDGGEDARPLIRITPVEYQFAIFTGADWPHAVTSLSTSDDRYCVVANFWLEGADQARPDGLDDYLYGDADGPAA